MSWWRLARPLGPLTVRIAAPRERVFEMIRVPYGTERVPRELREKVRVLERRDGAVLAAHRTKVGPFIAVTVETVTFAPPERVDFELVRGPVAAVTERFALVAIDGGRATELRYTGELVTEGWLVGAAWGALVARYWEGTVARAIASLKAAVARLPERPA